MKKQTFLGIVLLCLLAVLVSCGQGENAAPVKLRMPQNVVAANGVLTWDAVAGATAYVVTVQGTEYRVTDCRFSLSGLAEPGIYSLQVRAVGEGDTSPSTTATAYYTVAAAGGDPGEKEEDPPPEEKPTIGLSYTLLEDGSGYAVAEGTANMRGRVVIPDTYCGLPVVRVDFWASSLSINAVTTSIRFPKHLKTLRTGACGFYLALREVEIPAGVEEISNSAFYNCSSLQRVVLPEGVTRINRYAFAKCRSLREIVIPEGVTEVEEGAFSDCTSLRWADLPSTLRSLGKSAFSDCTNLQEANLPSALLSLGDFAFSGCEKLAAVHLPEGLTEMGGGAFRGTAVSRIVIPSTVSHLPSSFGDNCRNLTEVVIPAGITVDRAFFGTPFLDNYPTTSNGLLIINHSVVDYRGTAEELRAEDFPAHVTYIGTFAFARNETIRRVTLPDDVQMGMSTFYKCPNLRYLCLPRNLRSIPAYTASECPELREIIFPERVEIIGKRAFYRANLPEGFYEGNRREPEDYIPLIVLPDSVTTVESGAFVDCAVLGFVLPKNLAVTKSNFSSASSYHTFTKIHKLFYAGSKADFAKVSVRCSYPDDSFYPYLYYYSETAPTEEGNYWHYVDGVPTPW